MELNPKQFGFAISKSPLDYGVDKVRRMELLHPSAPAPDPKDAYFAPGSQPGAHPKALGFVDYSDRPEGPYIHYMATRPSAQGQGHGRALVDKMYDVHKDRKEVDWGRIMSDPAEHMFRDRRAKQEQPGYQGPRTYGKA